MAGQSVPVLGLMNEIIAVYTDPPALLPIVLMICKDRKDLKNKVKKNKHNIYFLTFCISIHLKSFMYSSIERYQNTVYKYLGNLFSHQDT